MMDMNVCAMCLLVTAATLPALVGKYARGEVVSLGGGGPRFASLQTAAVRGVEGQSATLQCRVLDLGDKAVSWIRTRDLQILSHGGVVFTADARVSVPTTASASVHALRIERLRRSDTGRYECQLNTEPKMSLFVHLIVVESEVEMKAATEALAEASTVWDEHGVSVWAIEGEVHGVRGGSAELRCEARRHTPPAPSGDAPPLDIRWLRAGKPLTMQGAGGGVWVSVSAGAAAARLRLERLRPQDAGNYTCAVGLAAATIELRVDEVMGDSEAMQRDQSVGASASAGGAGGAAAAAAAVALLAALLAALAAAGP